MRERHIFWDIAIIGLLLVLVVVNGLTLLQNQSIEKRRIRDLEALNAARADWRPSDHTELPSGHVPSTPLEHSSSYFDGSTNPKLVRGDEKADQGDTLTINYISAPNSLNPLVDNDATANELFGLANDGLARRCFDDVNIWEPQLAQGWEKAMVCRGIAAHKNAKELAAKLNAALTPEMRAKSKISKIEAESDDIVQIALTDTVGEYREQAAKILDEVLKTAPAYSDAHFVLSQRLDQL